MVRRIIFTGGIGKGDVLAEAEAARAYALQQGVVAEDIFQETVSHTTFENLRGAKKIVESEHLHRVLIVSDPFHMKRAITLARDLGLEAYPSPTPTSRYRSLRSQVPLLMHETYFYAVYLLKRPFVQETEE
jgi:uncharacterized SAM-binding protein YcdF (DUF218 family)